MKKNQITTLFFITILSINNLNATSFTIFSDTLKVDTLLFQKGFVVNNSIVEKLKNKLKSNIQNAKSDHQSFDNIPKIWNELMDTKIFDKVKCIVGFFYESKGEILDENRYMSVLEMCFLNNKDALDVFNFFDKVKKNGMIGYNLLGFNGTVFKTKNKLVIIEGMYSSKEELFIITEKELKSMINCEKVKYIYR